MQIKNEQYPQMLNKCIKNKIKLSYVLNDEWYASSKNMMFVKEGFTYKIYLEAVEFQFLVIK